jgi:hypothetical protein
MCNAIDDQGYQTHGMSVIGHQSKICYAQKELLPYGITSKTPEQANPEQVLRVNRQHWCIENSCHYILDWNCDEDRLSCRIFCATLRTAFDFMTPIAKRRSLVMFSGP